MSESQLDRELRSTIQGAARDQLAGWEFTPAMRQSVLNRIAAEEAGGVTTQMRPNGGRVASRRIGWRPMYAAAAAAAAVVLIFVMTEGGLFRSMEKAAPARDLASSSAPQAAMEAAPAPAPTAGQAIPSAAPPAEEPMKVTAAEDASGSPPEGAGMRSAAPGPPTEPVPAEGDVAPAKMPQASEADAAAAGIMAMDQGAAKIRSPQPTLVIMTGGQSGVDAYGSGDTVHVDVTLEAGSEQAWGGPIAVESWVAGPDGSRTDLPARGWDSGLPAGEAALMTAVTWDQTLAGGARAPAGEYSLYVRARAAGGQTSEGHVIIRLAP